jgi:putative ABC transport system permease protein
LNGKSVRPLSIKLWRDLKHIWPQALAIALVIACGSATLVIGVGAYRSLEETRRAYYERQRFADTFVTLTRAPRDLASRLAEIPGVATVEPRIFRRIMIDVPGMPMPASGLAISLSDNREQRLNVLHLRSGRLPEPESTDQVVVNEAFALAHNFHPGDRFSVVLNGRLRNVAIVGTALSPEFIYAIGPGDLMPDDRRFAILWMSEKPLAAAFDLDGAFDAATFKLYPGVVEDAVIEEIDQLVSRYGGTGAFGRKDHTSHAFIDAELEQLRTMSRIIPPIFLLVSAFLVNLTLSRLIDLQREQIGLLKAIGYDRSAVVLHYLGLVFAISVAGVVAGLVIGTLLGHGLTRLYADFFRFPYLVFIHDPLTYVVACIVPLLAAIAGATKSLKAVLDLPAAVAMQPPAPPRYRRHDLETLGQLIMGSQVGLIVARNVMRAPLRATLSATGLALSVALLIMTLFTFDSVDLLIDAMFHRADRQSATLLFAERKGEDAVRSASRLPGVLRTEPFRIVPARLSYGPASRRIEIVGKPSGADLSRVLDLNLMPVVLPETGIVLTERAAALIGSRAGDTIEVEALGDMRQRFRLPVTKIVQSYFGIQAFMNLDTLNRVMGEGPRYSGVHVSMDPARGQAFFDAVKATPVIVSTVLQPVVLEHFRKTIAQNIFVMVYVYTTLAMVIAAGVVYSSTRIQLSERARELASLRVLGFTRTEVLRVLHAELALLLITAQPAGWVLGYALSAILTQGFSSDVYRVPMVIERSTYATATLAVTLVAILAAIMLKRRVDGLDIVAVLKSRD